MTLSIPGAARLRPADTAGRGAGARPTPPMSGPAAAEVRTVPPGGLPAWSLPDPSATAVARLDPGLAVHVLEERPEGWAHVRCSNGWAAWVDGRLLVRAGARPGPGRPLPRVFTAVTTGPVALVGAAAAVLGGFLPWFSVGSFSVSAWDISMVALVRGSGTNDGLKAGAVLLVVALMGLPLLTHRPLPGIAVLGLAGVACSVALLAWLQNQRAEVSADIGVGLLASFAGGTAIIVDFVMGTRGRGG